MGKRSRRRDQDETVATPADGSAGPGPEAEDGAAPDRPTPVVDGRLREAIAYAEEVDLLYHLYRWTLLKGAVPSAADWARDEEMPHPEYVGEIFGSWQGFLDHSGIAQGELLVRLERANAAGREIASRELAVSREEKRAADLRRQLETARRKRDDAERRRDEHEREATSSRRALDAAEARGAHAEAALRELREAADTRHDEKPAAEPTAADDALRAELEAVREHRDQLLDELDQLREAAERDRRSIAELSAALGEQAVEAPVPAAEQDQDAPRSVLEAVRVAAEVCEHLVFTEAALDSAADSPYRRPREVLDALRTLDDIAERYDRGSMGQSLGAAAQAAGLTWRAGVSELARGRFARHYTVTHEDRPLELGPHLALGSGSGAGLVARIYLHVADGEDGVPRGIYVGHVGRHLPDTTT